MEEVSRWKPNLTAVEAMLAYMKVIARLDIERVGG